MNDVSMNSNYLCFLLFSLLLTLYFSYGARFPRPGETFVGNHFEMGCGGKAGNGCVAAARLGVSTWMIGKVFFI